MSYDFNANEILKMAEQIERNGYKFYKSAAENVAKSQEKEFLLKLAEMEQHHEKLFASIRSELSQQEREATVFDPENEVGLYIRALADTRVFFEKKIDISSMEEILKAAIVAEKDSIIFYLGLKNAVPERLGGEKIDIIIEEEMSHITLLSNELLACLP
jgi:rubrerythrin